MRKLAIILLMGVATTVMQFEQLWYRHKTEAEIARMTPKQLVDEYAWEQAHHKYDVLDMYSLLLDEYIKRAGEKVLPRIIEIIDEYDPRRFMGRIGNKGERFDAMVMLLGDLDNRVVRLRGTAEGRRALEALERAIGRMREAGYGQPDQHDWARHGRFGIAELTLKEAKGIGFFIDPAIRETLLTEYGIQMTDEEFRAYVDYLVELDPRYPSWSELEFPDFNKAVKYTPKVREGRRFYEAYLKFKRKGR